MTCMVRSSWWPGSDTFSGSAAHRMTSASRLGRSAATAAAARASKSSVIQLSRRTRPLGSSSIFREANSIRCRGVTWNGDLLSFFLLLVLPEKFLGHLLKGARIVVVYCMYRYRQKPILPTRVAEPEPEQESEPIGTVFIWGPRHRNRNRIQNTVPVPGTRK
jgi:hypothetical protein